MKTILVEPADLDRAAVLPQCLDIQYVSDSIFSYMQEHRKGFLDPTVIEQRQIDALTEYRRSLVYAKQTVVNRGYLFHPLVYGDFEDVPGNEENRLAFQKLVNDRGFVPYLYSERRLDEESDIEKTDRAREAWLSLRDLFSDVRCVRLHPDDDENRRKIKHIALQFRAFCTGLGELRRDVESLNALASEVFRRPMSAEELSDFGAALHRLSRFVVNSDQEVRRIEIYQEFLNVPGSKHYDGLFREDAPRQFILAQKKVLDLRYNTNLPDFLGRFCLTPLGLPTRAAITMFGPPPTSLEGGEHLLEDLRNQVAQTVVSRLQEAYHLPALRDLTLADVVAIRGLKEWGEFMEAQSRMLHDPIHCLDHLDAFARTFSKFQKAFSDWYYRTHALAERQKRYATVVRLGVKVMNMIALKEVDGLSESNRLVGLVAGELIPDKVYNFVGRLIIDIVDGATGRPDPGRSYSIDLMTSQIELLREDVAAIFAAFGAPQGRADMANAGTTPVTQ